MEKTKTIQIRVSTQEKSAIQTKAKSLNLHVSEYLLSLHQNTALPPPPSEVERRQLEEVAHIGNMVNELVTIMRSGKVPDTCELQLVIEAISFFVKSLARNDDC
ncbi:hypothetical protein J7438_22085 [Thalassotalea sp. G20_0]|uniref:plasmid mobilization protein n=1 Tax=Thalassotalea sp. G20_0 TaxID=2821093 RepID=UPI001ADD0A4A|nr:hypothetical protein [Thalassotalea sp. G20_0]MBO9496753.1 hypothetical protein [Thalassotalea sp. G20_0]